MRRTVLPAEVRQEIVVASNDPSIDKLQWNRWTSQNFVVCSIDDGQAKYLAENLENIKTWVYTRWGFDDMQFAAECRLICVNDPTLYQKFFRLNASQAEVHADSGKNKLFVVFCLLNDKPSKVIPGPLTEVCIANLNERYGITVPQWCVSGMKTLNSDIPTIRASIASLGERLKRNDAMYFGQGLFEMKPEEYRKLNDAQKKSFDESSTALLLMLRQEFGQTPLHHFIHKVSDKFDPKSALAAIYKFESYDQFDQSFKSYITDLSNDIAADKTPDKYLQITPANQ